MTRGALMTKIMTNLFKSISEQVGKFEIAFTVLIDFLISFQTPEHRVMKYITDAIQCIDFTHTTLFY